MSLADLTSPRAVELALEEFDRLGRDKFLEKYGFRRAREYFVRRQGRLYDSKAVAGAAHGFQHPDRGPLRPADFSGGDATVRVKLEELGFDVAVLASGPSVGASSSSKLEESFHRRMLEIYKAAKGIGYNASRFLGMVNEHGGLETARILLRASSVSDGYTALWERDRLDLTVEAVLLEPEWDELFSQEERTIAVNRLREYGYAGTLPAL